MAVVSFSRSWRIRVEGLTDFPLVYVDLFVEFDFKGAPKEGLLHAVVFISVSNCDLWSLLEFVGQIFHWVAMCLILI